MSTGAIIAIAVGLLVVLGGIVLATTARRSDARRGEGYLSRETVTRDRQAREREPVLVGAPATGVGLEKATPSAELVKAPTVLPAPYVPPDPETIGVTRRQFLNRGQVVLMAGGLAAFGGAVLAFLWSAPSGGFGGKINAGKLDEIKAGIKVGGGFFYVSEARSWITEYPAESIPSAESVYPGPVVEGMREGLSVLYQKCPHLGCRVPECKSSRWFECPCHGSWYNLAGEKKAGPAPRGMDRFGFSVSPGGDVVIDTGLVFQGPPIGTNTTGQEAEGPHCTGGAAE